MAYSKRKNLNRNWIYKNKRWLLDFDDLKLKLDSRVKAISITHVSNVTWELFDLKSVWEIISSCSPRPLGEGLGVRAPLFIVDASQSIPHFKVDIKEIWCDALFFTGHKLMSDSWIWILWGKEELLKNLKPAFSWWWAISWVKQDCFKEAPLPDKFEPGTPNLSWAISLLKALEYIDNIWWYKEIEEIEQKLNNYALEKFKNISWVKLIWWMNPKTRASVFSFIVEWIHSLDIADYMAENDICIRSGQHCAEPFMIKLWVNHTCRMSLYIYNTTEDIDKFFEILNNAIKELK